MKYNMFVENKDAENVNDRYAFVPAIAIKKDGTIIDNHASVKDCKFFANADSVFKFNSDVESYLQYFEYDKASVLLSSMKSERDNMDSKNTRSVKDYEDICKRINALENCIAENKCAVPFGNDCAKLYAFAISNYKNFSFTDIGFSISCDTLVRNLADCYKSGKKEEQIQDAKKLVEKWLTERLAMASNDIFKNVQVKLALHNGTSKVSIENILDSCFSELQKAGKKGITGKSVKGKEIIRQILLTYFRSIMEYDGQLKKITKASALVG